MLSIVLITYNIHTFYNDIKIMTDFWQTLNEQHPITQYLDSDNTNYLVPLSQLGIIQIAGEDASSFLQNLLTNDVNALDINQSQLNGFCNAKGRLLAIFLLIRRTDSFQLVLSKSMCDGLQQRLTMFKLRSKITITDVSDQLSLVGVITDAEKTTNVMLPQQNYHAAEHDNNLLLKLPSSMDRYLCIVHSDELEGFFQKSLSQDWQLASESSWQLLDIEQGLSTIVPDTKEKFTPQQLNFDLVGGISFNKGCYPGQEIVARLHYLGKPSRRLFSASSSSDKLPTAGEEVTDQEGNILGHVAAAQFSSDKNIKLLLSLKLTECDKPMFIYGSIAVTEIQALATD
jgi:tRNA-modifying protein YgfZ